MHVVVADLGSVGGAGRVGVRRGDEHGSPHGSGILFGVNAGHGMPRFCAAALVVGSLSRTLRQGLATLNAQFMPAFIAATL